MVIFLGIDNAMFFIESVAFSLLTHDKKKKKMEPHER